MKNRQIASPPDQLPLLFNRFVRSTNVEFNNIKGVGLGLYIVKGLVEAHGGKIWVESIMGKTTIFHFTVPTSNEHLLALNNEKSLLDKVTADKVAAEKFTPEKLQNLKDLKILIVDDSKDIRLLLRKYLEKTGAIVSEAAAADEALEKLMKATPDLIISDIEMPEDSGYDLIKRIHQWTLKSKINIPIIALTGHTDEIQLKKIAAAGFDAHLSKINFRNDLIATIQQLVSNNSKFPVFEKENLKTPNPE